MKNEQAPHQRPSTERERVLQEPGTGGCGGGEKMAVKQVAARGPKREGHFIFDGTLGTHWLYMSGTYLYLKSWVNDGCFPYLGKASC